MGCLVTQEPSEVLYGRGAATTAHTAVDSSTGHGRIRLERPHVSVSWCTGKQVQCGCAVECYTAVKRKDNSDTGYNVDNLKNVIISDMSQTQGNDLV